MLAPGAAKFLVPVAFGTALAVVLAVGTSGLERMVFAGIAIAQVGVLAFFAQFFRDPERLPGPDIVSAADGRVQSVVEEDGRWHVAVFMNVTDVHVNRFPLDAEVVTIRTTGSGFRPAYGEDAAHNVQRHYELSTSLGPGRGGPADRPGRSTSGLAGGAVRKAPEGRSARDDRARLPSGRIPPERARGACRLGGPEGRRRGDPDRPGAYMRGGRWPANLATLANLLVGVGAVLYVLAGNPLWAMLLITSGVGFDGLDGFLARKAGLGPSQFGRIADSIADATTFGLAPAALLIVHTENPALWQPLALEAWLVGGTFAALSIARLVYFTLRGYQNPDFLGAPTPQSALAVIVLTLFLSVPGFLGTFPIALLGLAAVIAVLMVLPIPYPKIRRGHPIRLPLAIAAAALVVSVLPLQFHLATSSPFYLLAEAAAVPSLGGVAIYYLVGPFTVPAPSAAASAKP